MLEIFILYIIAVGCFQLACSARVGVGIADMTGPAAQINFMGYAVPDQVGNGIHTRLRSRAFVFESDESDDAIPKRVAFVSMDSGMGSDLLNMKVLEKVGDSLGDHSLYTIENLSISGTHTHSGPAGFLQYVVYQFTSLGFVQETFDSFVDGVSSSIVDAHNDLKASEIVKNQGFLLDSNINRSPSSYLLNPEEERNDYADQGDTDKNMFLLAIKDADTGADTGG